MRVHGRRQQGRAPRFPASENFAIGWNRAGIGPESHTRPALDTVGHPPSIPDGRLTSQLLLAAEIDAGAGRGAPRPTQVDPGDPRLPGAPRAENREKYENFEFYLNFRISFRGSPNILGAFGRPPVVSHDPQTSLPLLYRCHMRGLDEGRDPRNHEKHEKSSDEKSSDEKS